MEHFIISCKNKYVLLYYIFMYSYHIEYYYYNVLLTIWVMSYYVVFYFRMIYYFRVSDTVIWRNIFRKSITPMRRCEIRNPNKYVHGIKPENDIILKIVFKSKWSKWVNIGHRWHYYPGIFKSAITKLWSYAAMRKIDIWSCVLRT